MNNGDTNPSQILADSLSEIRQKIQRVRETHGSEVLSLLRRHELEIADLVRTEAKLEFMLNGLSGIPSAISGIQGHPCESVDEKRFTVARGGKFTASDAILKVLGEATSPLHTQHLTAAAEKLGVSRFAVEKAKASLKQEGLLSNAKLYWTLTPLGKQRFADITDSGDDQMVE